MDELATAAGCMPELPPTDAAGSLPAYHQPDDQDGGGGKEEGDGGSAFARAMWYGPVVHAQYRLRGEGAWGGAEERVAAIASRL